ncbi:branched-chain amino acid ABC transporter permease [Brochothrix thermosphacta]|nr:branched-chain amino acid ABC transporter permease [Brochothrix thermosphacta]ODJ70883.1 branched-chain amino acid ABC transporter permease [Brochothrix thermosphacta]ODJ73689.1 branched-chain amino acid ABC transporter permease [Brochothrix thermosphacta]
MREHIMKAVEQPNYFKEGIIDCLPTLLGYISIGLACGIIGTASNLSVLEVTLLAIFVYAGAAQMVMTGLIAVGAPFFTIILTVAVVNIRFLLLSMTIAPHFKHESLLVRLGLGFLLTDESFGVTVIKYAKNRNEPLRKQWLMGLNITAYIVWIISCLVGALIGNWIKNPEVLGLDFALVAMFIALLVLQLELVERSKLRANLEAVATTFIGMFVFMAVMPSSLAVLVSTIIGAMMGVRREK